MTRHVSNDDSGFGYAFLYISIRMINNYCREIGDSGRLGNEGGESKRIYILHERVCFSMRLKNLKIDVNITQNKYWFVFFVNFI